MSDEDKKVPVKMIGVWLKTAAAERDRFRGTEGKGMARKFGK